MYRDARPIMSIWCRTSVGAEIVPSSTRSAAMPIVCNGFFSSCATIASTASRLCKSDARAAGIREFNGGVGASNTE
jgi:hypothetical protein